MNEKDFKQMLSTTARTLRKRGWRKDKDDLPRGIDLGIGVLVMALNIAEIVMLCRMKRKKKIYEVCLLSLSVTDTLFGAANAITSSFFVANKLRIPYAVNIGYTLYLFFVLTSIMHLVWITLDRVWLIFQPIKHKVLSTRRRLYLVLACTWIFTSLVAVLLFTVYHTKHDYHSHTPTELKQRRAVRRLRGPRGPYASLIRLIIAALIITADAIIISSYSAIVYMVNRQKTLNLKSGLVVIREKVSVLCVLVSVVFVLFTMPYCANSLVKGKVPMYANALLVSNSGMNSIVYFFRGRFEKTRARSSSSRSTSSNVTTLPISVLRERERQMGSVL